MSTLPLPTPLSGARDAAMNVSAVPFSESYLDDRERQVEPGRRTILSIFPVEAYRTIAHAGLSTYYHPAAQKDKIIRVSMNPARLTVQTPRAGATFFHVTETTVPSGERGYLLLQCVDTYQWVMNYERERLEPLPITAESAATSLLQEWRQGRRTSQGAIGMDLLDPTQPIDAQVNRLWDQQTAYFRSLVLEADGFFASIVPSERAAIGELHRKAAEWLGTEDRPWFRQQEEVRMKTCPKCSERIIASAVGCKFCQAFLPDYYAKYLALWDGMDTAVLRFWEQTKSTPKGLSKAAQVE